MLKGNDYSLNQNRQKNDEINQGIYSAEHTRQTYQKLADLTSSIINAGFSVFVDTTFLKLEQRAVFQKLAEEKQVTFSILDFQGTEAELNRRITQRKQHGNDVSEATLAVLQEQIKTAQPLTEDEQKMLCKIFLLLLNLQPNGQPRFIFDTFPPH